MPKSFATRRFLSSTIMSMIQYAKPICLYYLLFFNSASAELEKVKGGGLGGNWGSIGDLVYDGLPGNPPALDMLRDSETKICYVQNDDFSIINYKNSHIARGVSEFPCEHTDPEHNNIYWGGDFDSSDGGNSPSLDALYFASVTRKMFLDWYGVPPVQHVYSPAEPIVLNVNVDGADAQFINDELALILGSGDNCFPSSCTPNSFYPLTSLKIIAHELAHGFSHQRADFSRKPGEESAGLDESFSDMTAMAVEYYHFGNLSWEIGSEISHSQKSLRYIDTPERDGKSVSHYSRFNAQMDGHQSSGIFNRAYYLIANSSNWNPKKAFDVMAYANTHFWKSDTGFMRAACDAVNAAYCLGYNTSVIKIAMQEVGLPINDEVPCARPTHCPQTFFSQKILQVREEKKAQEARQAYVAEETRKSYWLKWASG